MEIKDLEEVYYIKIEKIIWKEAPKISFLCIDEKGKKVVMKVRGKEMVELIFAIVIWTAFLFNLISIFI